MKTMIAVVFFTVIGVAVYATIDALRQISKMKNVDEPL